MATLGNLFQPYFRNPVRVGECVELGRGCAGGSTWGVVIKLQGYDEQRKQYNALVRGMNGDCDGIIHQKATWVN